MTNNKKWPYLGSWPPNGSQAIAIPKDPGWKIEIIVDLCVLDSRSWVEYEKEQWCAKGSRVAPRVPPIRRRKITKAVPIVVYVAIL